MNRPPERRSGPSENAINALRKIRPDLKVIGASGLDWAVEQDDASRKLAQAFLRKPFTVEKLLHAARNVLDQLPQV
jgi:DNA-binding NtrC family response regulator